MDDRPPGTLDAPVPPAIASKREERQQQHDDDSPLRLSLVVCNIQKIANVKAMLSAAAAFGCSEVLLVGQENNARRKGIFPPPFLEALDRGGIALHRFPKWRDCVSYMDREGIFLVGVEIDERSELLDEGYFARNFSGGGRRVGVLMGNEGQGIQPTHLKSCGGLVRIPQYGAGTASMNVNVATSIVLYRFRKWSRAGGRKEHQT